METTIPDAMPTLSHGSHPAGSGQACVMEYVSVLAGEQWSDAPDCCHPMIASVARTMNDALYNGDRQLLVDLIPRLLTANITEGADVIGHGLHKFLVERQKPRHHRLFAGFCAICGGAACETFTGTLMSLIGTSMGGVEQVALLSDLLDEFDRLAGRDKPKVAVITQDRMFRAIDTVMGVPAEEHRPTFKEKLVAIFSPVEEKPELMWSCVITQDNTLTKLTKVDSKV